VEDFKIIPLRPGEIDRQCLGFLEARCRENARNIAAAKFLFADVERETENGNGSAGQKLDECRVRFISFEDY